VRRSDVCVAESGGGDGEEEDEGGERVRKGKEWDRVSGRWAW
jgi:hypothetical protein